jgi:hypothetical protein
MATTSSPVRNGSSPDLTVEQRFGPVGKQTIEDTGPLTKKRMLDIDQIMDQILSKPQGG